MLRIRRFLSLLMISLAGLSSALAQPHSVARQWNEQLLSAIRRDLARPPVHARNLFHVSAAMYDAWAAFDGGTETYLLGRTRGSFSSAFNGVAAPSEVEVAREEAISFAAYRIITHRFQNSPGHTSTQAGLDALMGQLGYDRSNLSTNYVTGGAAELGNYIAQQYIAFGYTDGANEVQNYAHQYYTPFNPPIQVELPGNPSIIDPNRWQQITVTNAVDQNGNPVQGTPAPVGHEWGDVLPFAMDPSAATQHIRDGNTYTVYHDPGPPALIDTLDPSGLSSFYKWNFCMVAIWQSHLDPDNSTLWDVSPGAIGGLQNYPSTPAEYSTFYDFTNGGANSPGHALNPVTGLPYQPQLVKRGDYTRTLAEFWADGPNSETPPGHWFAIMHSVMDHPLFERRWMGSGPVLGDLEYDVKAHLALGGAMHDAAMAAWSIKGWYDYVRPVSAIRYMAGKGQCTDEFLPNYHPAGIPLIPGYIEQVAANDELSGPSGEHTGKIKLYTWKGPGYIQDPLNDHAGVGWILAENWWPYQRPTFVTPPFAGYVSGHSTFSRSGAEVLTSITGTPYFPGGMSNFMAPQNNFLHFESGPSEDVFLQWATYRDASDQCSLSRIWGGIHPPIDDVPGRLIGQVIGPAAVDVVNDLIVSDRAVVNWLEVADDVLNIADIGGSRSITIHYDRAMNTSVDPVITYLVQDPTVNAIALQQAGWNNDQAYTLTYAVLPSQLRLDSIHLRIDGAAAMDGMAQSVFLAARPFRVDTDRPIVLSVAPGVTLINDALAATGTLEIAVVFSEGCDITSIPQLQFVGGDLSATLILNAATSAWASPTTYVARYTVLDANVEISNIAVAVSGVTDPSGNSQISYQSTALLEVDTRNPLVTSLDINQPLLGLLSVGSSALVIDVAFDEAMTTSLVPTLTFPLDDPLIYSLSPRASGTQWTGTTSYRWTYDLANANEELFNITATLQGLRDLAGNAPLTTSYPELFIVDTHRATVEIASPSVQTVTDNESGVAGFHIDVVYPEQMDVDFMPFVQITSPDNWGNSLQYNAVLSSWPDAFTYRAQFNVVDEGREIPAFGLNVSFARDLVGNVQMPFSTTGLFALDTRNPEVLSTTSNTYLINNAQEGPAGFTVIGLFDEAMDQSSLPVIEFNAATSLAPVLSLDPSASAWLNAFAYRWIFDVGSVNASIAPVGITLSAALDAAGNPMTDLPINNYLTVDLQVGLIELGNNGSSLLFPNPARSGTGVTYFTAAPLNAIVLNVVDVQGSEVLSKHIDRWEAGHHVLALPKLDAGLYFVQVRSAERSHTVKLVVE